MKNSRIFLAGLSAVALMGTSACVTDPNTGEKKISRTVLGGVGGVVAGGLLGGVICYLAVILVRVKWKFDDSLDVFAVHGVGGMLGILILPLLSHAALGGTGEGDFMVQLTGLAAVIAISVVGSVIILGILKVIFGLRVTEDQEREGLDYSLHGESAYND